MAQYQATTHQQITIDRSKLKKKRRFINGGRGGWRRASPADHNSPADSCGLAAWVRQRERRLDSMGPAAWPPGRLGAATGEEAGGKRHCIRLLLGEAALRWNGTAAPRRGVAAVSSSSVFASSGAGRRIQ
ncbi:unnamed protein product [Urochloa humidicola]